MPVSSGKERACWPPDSVELYRVLVTGILGVSHLVITATDLDAEAVDLHLGYRVSVSRDDMPNRHQKAPFIQARCPILRPCGYW